MRIALVTASFFPRIGGAEYVVHNLATAWQSQGHKVCVFNSFSEQVQGYCNNYAVQKYGTPFSYFRFAPHRFPFGKYCSRNIKQKLDEFNPEFISAHVGYPLGVWLSRIRPLPKFLITCHGRELTDQPWGHRKRYGIDRVLTEALNMSVGAVAISRHARKTMEAMGVDPRKILDIPNGVDKQRFGKKVSANFRAMLGISREALLILSVGREHSQKAYNNGIKAFHKIACDLPGAVYAIVGRGTTKWIDLVRDLDLQGRVFLSEGLEGDNLVAAYQQADIFFSPSSWEMMPLVVLEAMASGLPLVVTNVSGSQDLVDPGENGIIVEPSNLDEMAASLRKLISNGDIRKKMSEMSLAKSENYSWDSIAKRYINSFFNIVNP